MDLNLSDLLVVTLRDLSLPSDVLLWKALLLTVISLLVGVLGGFVGLALGTIRLPALLLFGIPPSIAGGTNIMVSGLSSLSGSIRHWRAGRVDMRIVLVMGIPAFAGAFAGGFLSGIIHDGVLLLLAGLLVLWQGIEFIIIYRNRVKSEQSSAPLFGAGLEGSTGLFSRGRISAEAGIGLGVGLLGGSVGLILGSIRLPALVRVLKVDPRIAAGTNLFIGFFMGTVGWVGHATQGKVDYPLLIFMGAFAIVGSWYGAKLTGRVNLNTLILVMGFVLLIVGLLLAYRGIAPLM